MFGLYAVDFLLLGADTAGGNNIVEEAEEGEEERKPVAKTRPKHVETRMKVKKAKSRTAAAASERVPGDDGNSRLDDDDDDDDASRSLKRTDKVAHKASKLKTKRRKAEAL